MNKKPKRCKGCAHYWSAGHKEGTNLYSARYMNWCCKYSTATSRAQSICKLNNGKQLIEEGK